MYLTIEQIKKHLNIDEDFIEDDEYLITLCAVAENAVERYIDKPLSDYEDNEGNIEPGLVHALLLFIGNLYENRESTTSKTISELPFAYQMLLDLFQQY